MDDRPNLELPQRTVARRPIFDRRSGFFAVCVLVLFGVVVALLVRRSGPIGATASARNGWTADQDKALAMRLEDRNLHTAAAQAWERYLNAASLGPQDEAAVRYRVGKLYQSAERYEDAIAAFYQAEAMLGQAKEDLKHEINVRVRDCFVKLGQYGDLDRDLAERTAPEVDKSKSLAGQQVVAEIGAEKITVADFDRMLQQEVDLMIKAMPGLSSEQVDQIRQEYAKRFASPQARVQKLQELVSVKVLARKAREQGLEKTPEFRKRLAEMSDMLLANRLAAEEIGPQATVTVDDCKRYYEANKARYVEPGRATIAHIVCKTEAQAADLVKQIKGGASFEALAKQHSQDEATKDKGGVIEQPVSESGEFVPGMGQDKALHEAIFAAKAATVLEKPYKGDGGFQVIKVVDRKPAHQLTLDEAADQLRADTQRARTREVSEQYMKELFEQAKVHLYPEAFAQAPAATQPAGVGKDHTEGSK